MPTGTIKSYSAQKAYGFIESESGDAVFFHISKVKPSSKENIKSGCIVSFDECPTPKGLAAENVMVEGKASELFLNLKNQEVLLSKSESCGKDTRVVHKLHPVTVEDRNPDTAIEMLKAAALRAGCNAIVNLKRNRRTGEAWTSEYKYSIHVMTAEPALVKRVAYTTDLRKAKESKLAIESEIRQLESTPIESIKVNDASGFKAIFAVIGIIVFLIIFASMMN